MSKISIESSELKKLQNRVKKLDALEAGGVDNWEWADESLKEYNATIAREENIDNLLDDLCEILFSSAYEPSERGAGFTCTEDAKESAFKMLNKRIKDLKP